MLGMSVKEFTARVSLIRAAVPSPREGCLFVVASVHRTQSEHLIGNSVRHFSCLHGIVSVTTALTIDKKLDVVLRVDMLGVARGVGA